MRCNIWKVKSGMWKKLSNQHSVTESFYYTPLFEWSSLHSFSHFPYTVSTSFFFPLSMLFSRSPTTILFFLTISYPQGFMLCGLILNLLEKKVWGGTQSEWVSTVCSFKVSKATNPRNSYRVSAYTNLLQLYRNSFLNILNDCEFMFFFLFFYCQVIFHTNICMWPL